MGRAHSIAAFAVTVDLGIFRFTAGVPDRRRVAKPKSKSKAAREGARPSQSRVCRLAPTHLYFSFAFYRDSEDQEQRFFMPKRTFQPNRRHRSKTHGFLTRMKTKAGRAVI